MALPTHVEGDIGEKAKRAAEHRSDFNERTRNLSNELETKVEDPDASFVVRLEPTTFGQEILDYIAENGTATVAEIIEHFNLGGDGYPGAERPAIRNFLDTHAVKAYRPKD